nr:hypothetical protein [Tanacetum cinerariifolium]
MMSEDSSAAGTDNCPSMLEESDYESWKIHIKRYIKGKTHRKLIWKSILNGPSAHPQITDPVPTGSPAGTVMQPRDKKDEEFTNAENLKELCDIQASNILSQGLPRRIFNTLNQTQSAKEIWECLELLMQGLGQTLDRRKEDLFDKYERFRANGNELIQDYFVRTHKLINDMMVTKLTIPTHQMNTKFVNNLPPYWSNVVGPLAYLVKTTHQQTPTHSTTTSPSQLTPALSSTSSSTAQSHDDAMLATMKQIANLLSGFQKQFPPTNNQLRSSSNTGTHATMHDGQITTESVQRQASVLDAEAEAFLANVECTIPLAEPLALTTTNIIQVNHEDAYDSDVDDEPNTSAAFMANLSSSSSQINEVRTFNDNIFETVSPSWPSEVPQDEHLDSDEDSASLIPPTAAYMLQTLTDLTTQVEGHRKVIVARNKRNAELEKETELLQTTLRNKEATIASLTSETKTVLSEKKTLEEIVCLKNANQVATGLLQKFQMLAHTIPMLSKRPMIASND